MGQRYHQLDLDLPVVLAVLKAAGCTTEGTGTLSWDEDGPGTAALRRFVQVVRRLHGVSF
jgi:hypothetical protein